MGIGKGFLRGLWAILISPAVVVYYAIALVYALISFPIKGLKYLIQFFMGVGLNEPDEETKLLNEYKNAKRKMMEANNAQELEKIREFANHDDLDDFLNNGGSNNG